MRLYKKKIGLSVLLVLSMSVAACSVQAADQQSPAGLSTTTTPSSTQEQGTPSASSPKATQSATKPSAATKPQPSPSTPTKPAPSPSATPKPTGSSAPTATIHNAQVKLPPSNAVFDYQLGGPYQPSASTGIVVRDHSAKPAPGKYNICYINAFQSQPEEKSTWLTQRAALLLRDQNQALVEDGDWAGEYFLDTRTQASRSGLLKVAQAWIKDCADKGFDAIEPDNLDTYTRSDLLSRDGNLAYAKMLAEAAHGAGLAIAQKNDSSITASEKTSVGFDFAVVEECERYDECDEYSKVYGKQMYEIEYTDAPNASEIFDRAKQKRGDQVSITLRDRALVPLGASGYVNENG